jgi:hypothetical protein
MKTKLELFENLIVGNYYAIGIITSCETEMESNKKAFYTNKPLLYVGKYIKFDLYIHTHNDKYILEFKDYGYPHNIVNNVEFSLENPNIGFLHVKPKDFYTNTIYKWFYELFEHNTVKLIYTKDVKNTDLIEYNIQLN